MTREDARKLLGLGPDEDARPALADFQQARERIAAMVRDEQDVMRAARYQDGLIEFDRALAVIREELIERDPAASPPATTRLAGPRAATASKPAAAPRRQGPAMWAGLTLFLAGTAAAVVWYYQNEENLVLHRQARIAVLEREGSVLVENRRWQEAAAAFAEIDALEPGSELARRGRRHIEAGIAEEQNQFVGYWTGQALAELDAGRLDEADHAIQQVITKFPAEHEAVAIFARITAARVSQVRDAAVLAARQQLAGRHWEAAIESCQKILASAPDHAEARAMLEDARVARAKYAADQTKAKDLLAMAIARDQGRFDAQALDWLREAVALAPDQPDIAARLEKMAAYSRTLRVPGDFATPAEALAAAHDRDRIVLAEQVWKGVLVVNAAIELQGAGSAKTIVECPAADGSPITMGPNAKGARISGITFRHEAFQVGDNDRFSAALVRGGDAIFVDCHFSNASGHGLVVIDQGKVSANRCRFADNGWNGAAAIGMGSVLEIRESEALYNFEHGIESWNGATATLVNNRCEGNSRNGIHVDNDTAAAILEGNQLIANREFGLVLDSAGSGKITTNTARANLLGGVVVRTRAAALTVTGNQLTLNQGPGLILEKGLAEASYSTNAVSRNQPPQILADAKLTWPEEPKSEKSPEID